MQRVLSNAPDYEVKSSFGKSNRVNFVIRITLSKISKSTPDLGFLIIWSIFPAKVSFKVQDEKCSSDKAMVYVYVKQLESFFLAT